MAEYRMLSTAQVARLIERWPPPLQDIALELRSLIVTAAPGVTEARQRKGFTYYFAERGGPVSAGLCQILFVPPEQLRLAFNHGAFLPDPRGLLVGERKYKRYVPLTCYERAPWDDLRALLAASARFDPYTLTLRAA